MAQLSQQYGLSSLCRSVHRYMHDALRAGAVRPFPRHRQTDAKPSVIRPRLKELRTFSTLSNSQVQESFPASVGLRAPIITPGCSQGRGR